MATNKFNSIPPKRLAQSITSASTTFVPTDILGFDGIPLTSTIIGSIAYGSFQNLNGTVLELFSFDPTTIANAAGISFVSRGLQFNEDGTFASIPANQLAWVKGITIIQLGTDSPALFAWLKNYIDAASIAGAVPAATTTLGIAKLSVAPVSAPSPIVVGDNDTRMLTTGNATALTALITSIVGMIVPYAGRSAPTGFLLCDGSAVSRTTYATLLSIIAPSQTATITIASPGVFTATAHGLVAGDKVHLTTTGGLPSGLATNTDYYVISTGLSSNAFELALSPGGAAINTTGSQSGTHTLYKSAYGKGDGSTTFNVPDLRARVPIGLAASAPATSLSFEPAAVSAGSDNVTIINAVFPSQGQLVQLTSTGTLPAGLSLATNYWIVRSSATTIKFSTSQANANAATPTVVDITDQGSGVHTLTFTNLTHTILGKNGGEDTHGQSAAEIAGHVHSQQATTGTATGNYSPLLQGTGGSGATSFTAAGTAGSNNINSPGTPVPTISAGSDTQHNNMQPYAVINYIIKY